MLNQFIKRNIKAIELIGVIMRIVSFTVVGWLGPKSPFLFVWAFNSIDAVFLAWCSILKKDLAYALLNLFWVLVGVLGIVRTVSGN